MTYPFYERKLKCPLTLFLGVLCTFPEKELNYNDYPLEINNTLGGSRGRVVKVAVFQRS